MKYGMSGLPGETRVHAVFVSRLLFPHSAIADSDLPTNPSLLVLMLFSLDTVVCVCVPAFCLNECSSFWCK